VRQVNAAPGTQWRPERGVARVPRAPSQATDRPNIDRPNIDGPSIARPNIARPKVDHHKADRNIDRYNVDRQNIGRNSDRSNIDRHNIDRHDVDRNSGRTHNIDRHSVDRSRIRLEPGWRPAAPKSGLERGVVLASAGLLIGAAGCFWLLFGVFGAPFTVAPSAILQAPSTTGYAATEVVRSGKSDSLARSAHPMIARADPVVAIERVLRKRPPDAMAGAAGGIGGSAVSVQTSSFFEPDPDRVRDKDRIKATTSQPLTRLAGLEMPAPRARPAPQPGIARIPPDGDARTALIDFKTAPFPYDGRMPGSNRPFLDAGQPGHRGHTNFRGRVLWESETFSDPRVLLHIPPGFDANRPGVMVVFFHGHGANLATDVRDRQQVPAQISASGMNAVLVAPQFAFDAADSSAGKFWEPGGFKRFVDEAAEQLARLHGDPRTARTFADMPIVIVAYSGGFGPTLAVLDHGGVKSRLHGIVLLDALYSGIDKFADWIAENRSGFFVSSYTPHTRGHNADLEQLLRAKSVSYGAELRHDHLPGSVTFLPAGPISHRDFVTHAWADSPLKDILVRLDEYDPRVQTATAAAVARPLAATAAPSRN
jgi:hypothetical protein